jgi:hypothetical protein
MAFEIKTTLSGYKLGMQTPRELASLGEPADGTWPKAPTRTPKGHALSANWSTREHGADSAFYVRASGPRNTRSTPSTPATSQKLSMPLEVSVASTASKRFGGRQQAAKPLAVCGGASVVKWTLREQEVLSRAHYPIAHCRV